MDIAKQPLVSIIFTSYNHKEYLQQALDSLIDQTYANTEIIVIDDNSSDGSKEILKTYAATPKISLHLLEKNTGSYVKASNYGASFAKGEYYMFAQCDDFAEPDQIEKLMGAFAAHKNVGVVYSKSKLVDEAGFAYSDDFKGREQKFRDKCAADTVITGAEMREFLSFGCVIPNLSAAILKKELYIETGGLSTDYLVAADWAFWLDLAERTDFYYLTSPLNNFRQHATTIRSKIKLAIQVEEIYAIFYKHIKKYNLKGEAKAKMRSGAGSIWFWYFLDDKKTWLLSFYTLFKKTFAFEKLNIYYLIAGFFRRLKERFNK